MYARSVMQTQSASNLVAEFTMQIRQEAKEALADLTSKMKREADANIELLRKVRTTVLMSELFCKRVLSKTSW